MKKRNHVIHTIYFDDDHNVSAHFGFCLYQFILKNEPEFKTLIDYDKDGDNCFCYGLYSNNQEIKSKIEQYIDFFEQTIDSILPKLKQKSKESYQPELSDEIMAALDSFTYKDILSNNTKLAKNKKTIKV